MDLKLTDISEMSEVFVWRLWMRISKKFSCPIHSGPREAKRTITWQPSCRKWQTANSRRVSTVLFNHVTKTHIACVCFSLKTQIGRMFLFLSLPHAVYHFIMSPETLPTCFVCFCGIFVFAAFLKLLCIWPLRATVRKNNQQPKLCGCFADFHVKARCFEREHFRSTNNNK